jgi:hypothetical protein
VDSLNLMLRGTPAMHELKPSSQRLVDLNSTFTRIAPQVPTLSFGENDKSCFGSKFTCVQVMSSKLSIFLSFQVVSDDSANPGFPGPHHKFVKLDYNHREVCKPVDRQSLQYKMVVDFIQNVMNENKKQKLK